MTGNSDRPGESRAGSPSGRLRRRAVLAAGGALLGSGCVQRTQSLVDRSNPKPVSLTVRTLPADADPVATTVARTLVENLQAVGVDAEVVLQSREELYRSILLDQDFGAYVARFPHVDDPDFLRPLLHSQFSGDPGWANPFGYTNLELDETLAAQARRSGVARVDSLREVEATVARDQPFTVLAFPDRIGAVRTDQVRAPELRESHAALRYLSLDPVAETKRGGPGEGASRADDGEGTPTPTPTPPSTATPTPGTALRSDETTLGVTIGDARPTESLNPLSTEFRNGMSVVDLLYDSLGRWIDGRVRPWLAADWTWRQPTGDDGPRALVTVRPDLTWHDGTPLTPTDVAFSYRFLADTSLGRAESAVPAPNYRGESSLVSDVGVTDDGRVELQFRELTQQVASRALTVPILPKHVWKRKSREATIASVDTGGAVTEALVWNNMRPVGSGPLRFDHAAHKESLVLRPFADHFLTDSPDADHLSPYAGGFPFDRLVFTVVPSPATAVELLSDGAASVAGTPLSAKQVPRIGGTERLALRVSRPKAFYHVGYNARRPPTSNTRFRRAVAHLLDKGAIVDDLLGGYADAAASPLARSPVHDPDLRWTGTDPVTPFPGTDGRLDVARARELFRDAGYRYAEDGSLLAR